MIKKHKDKNEYYLTPEKLWVRNFTKTFVPYKDINDLIPLSDMNLFLSNEIENRKKMLQQIDTEELSHPNILIISDGYKFNELQNICDQLKNIFIIAVNGVLRHWAGRKPINYYVVNNPYAECLSYLPKKPKLWPKCIASCRTNPQFINKYKGLLYQYHPTPSLTYSGLKTDATYSIDDYRNTVCATVGLCHHFQVEKLLLLCCDEAYEHEKPGMIKLPNGLWTYPQQELAHNLIDANLYWLKQRSDGEMSIAYHSYGSDYKNAVYIESEKISEFFSDG